MENGDRKIFGTDGVRGTANVEPLTVETVVKLGRAAAAVFRKGDRRHRIVIGKDTRMSGYMIEAALEAGICSMGVDVILVGPLPTPGIAFITRSLKADAGAVISASHNPYDDNGIKFFSMDGMKLPDAVEARMEALMTSAEVDAIRPTASDVGKAYRVDDAVGRYIEHAKATFPRGMTLDGVRIALDTANGAAYKAAPSVFEELGADVATINASPDGQNINAGCGSLHIEGLAALVREKGAALGVALDGDADRCLLVDEAGVLVDGDRMMALLAKGMKERGELAKETLVATVMSNKGLDAACSSFGCRLERTQVGDRYVLEEMMRGGFCFGGEQSGHLIFADYGLAGDGCVTALQVLALMRRSGKLLSELASVMTVFPQVLLNLEVARKLRLDEIPGLAAITTGIEKELGDRGRLLLRYSGTQPLLRIMIEGEDEVRIREMAEEIRGHLCGRLSSPDGA